MPNNKNPKFNDYDRVGLKRNIKFQNLNGKTIPYVNMDGTFSFTDVIECIVCGSYPVQGVHYYDLLGVCEDDLVNFSAIPENELDFMINL